MEPFTVLDSPAVPLDVANVDTDAIMPKQFMKTLLRTGLGDYLFDAWRYRDPGEPGKPKSTRQPVPEFCLNQRRYADARILLARENFGCGSSREHACWALADYGIRAIIAPSFADIFFNNCFKNGLLPIVLPRDEVDALFTAVASTEGYGLRVDLPRQEIITSDGRTLAFPIDAYRKQCLVEALDDVTVTLRHAEAIRHYEARRRSLEPWLFP